MRVATKAALCYILKVKSEQTALACLIDGKLRQLRELLRVVHVAEKPNRTN